MFRRPAPLAALAALLATATPAGAGNLILTGHDPDAHATGANWERDAARHFLQTAVSFILDANVNPFARTGIPKFLFVESKIPLPSGFRRGMAGLVASGYVEGRHFEHHDATTLSAQLDSLGIKYAAIVVASDFGCTLTQAELDILNARAADLGRFLDAGGGLFAMAESNDEGDLTPLGPHYGFVPGIESELLFQLENGFTVTRFGASLGFSDFDVSGNASHAYFRGYGDLQPVTLDAMGRAITVAHAETPTPVREISWGGLKRTFGRGR